jgi:nucleoid DNA-binding protein
MVAQFRDQFYIPFYRIFEDAQATAEFIKAPVNTKKLISAQIKKLQGSKRQMGDPLENIMTNWAHLLKQSMTNMSRKEAFEILVANEAVNEMGEPIVEEVPWKDTVIFKPGGKRMNDYGGADTVTFVYQKDNVEVLGFKDNGKTRFFKVNDAELFNAMSLQNTKTLPKWLSMILGAPKALLTFGATVTPGFVVANTLRDTLHTYTIADGFIPFISTAKGFYKTLIKDQDYVEYMASGNSFVGSYVKAESAEEFNKYTKKIIAKEGRSVLKRILTSPAQLWNFWRTITEASENAARLELYALKKRQGATKLEASFAARDIMDFQKKGASAVVQYLTLTVPFLNARIQGLVKMGQAAAARPGMYALKGATVAIASLALWAAYKDDDRYKELEAWEKFAYYHFWIGDKHFRIPKPFETGVIWSSAFTAAADVAVKNEEADHIMSFIGTAMMDTFAFNPVPQAARPLLEQYMNKNFFTGRPIVSESLKYRKPADRYSPWDHESMIALGKLLNVSPKRAQSLVRGYLAGLGTGIMSGADIMVRQFGDFPARPESTIDSYPMIGRFVRSTPSRYTKFQSSFYEVFNQLNELNQTIRIAQRDGRFVEADELRKLNNKKMIAFGKGKIVKNRLAFISKKMNNIWLSKSMDPKRKRLEINKLTIERNEIVKDFYTWYLSNK